MPILLLGYQGGPSPCAVGALGAWLAYVDGGVKGVAPRGAEGALLGRGGDLPQATPQNLHLDDGWDHLHTDRHTPMPHAGQGPLSHLMTSVACSDALCM